MAHFHHTHCVKSSYATASKSNAPKKGAEERKSEFKPIFYTPDEDDYASNNDEDNYGYHEQQSEDNVDPASRFLTWAVFFILFALCVNTIVDLREPSQKASLKVHQMAASLRDELKGNSLSSGDMPATRKKVYSWRRPEETNEQFKLEGFYRMEKGKVKELSSVSYTKAGPVIVILTTNTEKDVGDTQIALRSLEFLSGDIDPARPAPILIFNEGDLREEQTQTLIESAGKRPISFPYIDFREFPEGLDLKHDGQKFNVKGRKNPWGYHQMIRFWVTRLWTHPAIENFDIIMRMDSDSCFKSPNEFLPGFRNEDVIYHSQFVGMESGANYMDGLIDHAEKFLVKYHQGPGNEMLWRYAKAVWESKQTLPLFMTNFEVTRKSWMQRNIIMRWHESLTEEKPYGVFTHRWGDAVTRFVMVSLFALNFEIDTSYADGYFHKDGCKHDDVLQALDEYHTFLHESHKK